MKTRNYILILFTSIFLGRSYVSYSQICFMQADTFAVNNQPGSIISADFNGDNKVDLAVGNNTTNDLSILLGTGTGVFGTATNFPIGSSPYSVCSADFNGDGKIDLVTANYVSSNVSVLFGNGLGSFGAPINFGLTTHPNFVCSADFNGDGKNDLATANGSPYNIAVFIGNGVGGFSSPTYFSMNGPGGPNTIVSADFNGDNKVDLATSEGGSNNVTAFIGNGAGSFATAINFPATTAVSIISADFNNDGKKDLATANGSSGKISILLGTGTGSFAVANNFSVCTGCSTNSLISADFDKDGKADIATANYTSNTISILVGTGTGSFAAPINYTVNTSPVSIVSADFNGDSMPDLATSNLSSNNVAILLNCSPVGINQYTTDDEQVIIYPNPASTIVDIKFKMQNKTQSENFKVQVTNLLGEEMKEVRSINQDTKVEIDISNLQNGIYFANIKTSEGIVTKKIVVQH